MAKTAATPSRRRAALTGRATNRAAGDRRDLEQDPAESGIGDADGLHEQVGTQDWQQGSMG
ncbi:hypothetical protein V1289_008597 [Bradyrhizobium sp. AZCC 2289]